MRSKTYPEDVEDKMDWRAFLDEMRAEARLNIVKKDITGVINEKHYKERYKEI